MEFFVYILQSQINHSFYKGSTEDLTKRLCEHNEGKSTFTKKYVPWNLVWYTIKNKRAEAVNLEMKLKNLSVERTIDFIKKYPVSSDIIKISTVVQP